MLCILPLRLCHWEMKVKRDAALSIEVTLPTFFVLEGQLCAALPLSSVCFIVCKAW
jgi:hypothetical protein